MFNTIGLDQATFGLIIGTYWVTLYVLAALVTLSVATIIWLRLRHAYALGRYGLRRGLINIAAGLYGIMLLRTLIMILSNHQANGTLTPRLTMDVIVGTVAAHICIYIVFAIYTRYRATIN